MPALFAAGQHRALVAISERLLPHEYLMAFLEVFYVVYCKTQVWNRGQMVPDLRRSCGRSPHQHTRSRDPWHSTGACRLRAGASGTEESFPWDLVGADPGSARPPGSTAENALLLLRWSKFLVQGTPSRGNFRVLPPTRQVFAQVFVMLVGVDIFEHIWDVVCHTLSEVLAFRVHSASGTQQTLQVGAIPSLWWSSVTQTLRVSWSVLCKVAARRVCSSCLGRSCKRFPT